MAAQARQSVAPVRHEKSRPRGSVRLSEEGRSATGMWEFGAHGGRITSVFFLLRGLREVEGVADLVALICGGRGPAEGRSVPGHLLDESRKERTSA